MELEWRAIQCMVMFVVTTTYMKGGRMKVFYLITARGGSKGVPKKNIREIGGLPLIAYKIIAAQKCGFPGRVIVSTDDMEIAEVAKCYNAEVPFMRPGYLASDTASSMDVVWHALNWLDAHDRDRYDYICLLEPSSPFATPADLHDAIQLIKDKDADTLLGMKEAEVSRRFIWGLDEKGGLSNFYDAVYGDKKVRRQDQKTEYTMNGCMYISRTGYFRDNKIFHSKNSVPYIMPAERSTEIDDMLQFNFAKYCVDSGLVDIKDWM